MRIAITGGSGSVGRAVVKLAVEQGHSVVNIDRVEPRDVALADVEFIQADLTRYDEFERSLGGCDALIHLAAIPSPRGHVDHEVHNNNVVTSYNALRAAVEVGIKHIAQASSINAIGSAYSRWPRYEYLPLDEAHPTYNEDPYSLSKWIMEQQADSFARRYEDMRIASLRFHWVVPDRATAVQARDRFGSAVSKHLWAYTSAPAAASACLKAITAQYTGHEVFFIVAPDTIMDTPSLDLARQFFPDVPLRGDLPGTRGFFDCEKAERLLGWRHDTL